MDKKGYVEQIRKEFKSGEKRYTKTSLEKVARSYGITNKNIVKESTELALVLNARDVIDNKNLTTHQKYTAIVAAYKAQVNISMRTSRSVLLQQYSTPTPISFLASSYVLNNKPTGLYFEPSAGNGLLSIALPYARTVVNEIDDERNSNLKSQPYLKVLKQDALKPFAQYYKKFAGVVTNPPFGKLSPPIEYHDFPIKVLDHAMCINALECMEDDGKASLIVGGHTRYDENGRPQSGKNRIFLNYLYHHYNVQDVIFIDGKKLYYRQGTSVDVRLILINGRKETPNGIAPVLNDTLGEVIDDFERLWIRVGLKSFNEASKWIEGKINKKQENIDVFYLEVNDKSYIKHQTISKDLKQFENINEKDFSQLIEIAENKNSIKIKNIKNNIAKIIKVDLKSYSVKRGTSFVCVPFDEEFCFKHLAFRLFRTMYDFVQVKKLYDFDFLKYKGDMQRTKDSLNDVISESVFFVERQRKKRKIALRAKAISIMQESEASKSNKLTYEELNEHDKGLVDVTYKGLIHRIDAGLEFKTFEGAKVWMDKRMDKVEGDHNKKLVDIVRSQLDIEEQKRKRKTRIKKDKEKKIIATKGMLKPQFTKMSDEFFYSLVPLVGSVIKSYGFDVVSDVFKKDKIKCTWEIWHNVRANIQNNGKNQDQYNEWIVRLYKEGLKDKAIESVVAYIIKKTLKQTTK